MFDVHTVPLTRTKLLDFIKAARRAKPFRAVSPHWNTFTFCRQTLGDFLGYELMPDTSIELCTKAGGFTPKDFQRFWVLLDKLRGSGLVQLRIAITESGRKFNPARDQDLEIAGGAGFAGLFLDIQVGSLSPNFTSQSHWRQVARQLWESPSKKSDLHARNGGGCCFLNPETVVLGSSSPEAIKSVCGQGRVALIPHRYAPGAIAWGLSEAHLKSALQRALKPPAPARVEAAEITAFFSNIPHYLGACQSLNETQLAPWVVSVTARPCYTQEELIRLTAEDSTFAAPIFELQMPESEDLMVELESGNGSFYLHFNGDFKDGRQKQALDGLVEELSMPMAAR